MRSHGGDVPGNFAVKKGVLDRCEPVDANARSKHSVAYSLKASLDRPLVHFRPEAYSGIGTRDAYQSSSSGTMNNTGTMFRRASHFCYEAIVLARLSSRYR
jgi:hypothetical protein